MAAPLVNVIVDEIPVQVPPGTITPLLKPTEVPELTPPVRVAVPPPLQATLPEALLCKVPV